MCHQTLMTSRLLLRKLFPHFLSLADKGSIWVITMKKLYVVKARKDYGNRLCQKIRLLNLRFLHQNAIISITAKGNPILFENSDSSFNFGLGNAIGIVYSIELRN